MIFTSQHGRRRGKLLYVRALVINRNMSSRESSHGGVSFSLMDAARLGFDYIKRRIQRAAIIMASIALAVAFLTSLILTDLFYRVYSSLSGATLSVETYQYWLVFVALVVSVVGITNAMLIAVYERYREIGTMKCLGALDRHIVLLFLVEAIIQGLIGGSVGFVLGAATGLLSAGFTTGFDIILKVPGLDLLGYFIGSVILSVGLSAAATLYPALRAARLNPVEALRYEL
jgi:hypothetical protein